MSEDLKYMSRTEAHAAAVDVGLREYMLRVYNFMASGVALTGIVAAFVAQSPQLMVTILGGPLKWVLFIGIIGLGFMAPKIIMTKSVSAAHAAYWAYAGLFGLWLAPIFIYYTSTSIRRGSRSIRTPTVPLGG